ncbi:hypothetical protein EQG49_13230 [Periweissella cryptocerci]|uniref:MucBP domain-containing protein n=1 Tax=Periweissella cryptocerci TaxID=2506420 RepID=A0A4P6YWS6_9LACO|nr:leucine-rich repeat protein [Periweissella cryptocerci]QBO37359.1 hypothetical protein EQG49_13230 [Periweissella cryptocerci]
MENQTKQHFKMYKSGKNWVYAGLATITLISGMGATPVVLADALVTEQSEITATDSSKDDEATETTSPVIEIPDVLPDGDLTITNESETTKVTEDTTTSTEVSAKETAEDPTKTTTTNKVDQAKSAKPEVAKDTATKAKTPRTAHTFVKSDFSYDAAGTTITGFSSSFTSSDAFKAWDGNLTITGDDFANVVALGQGAFLNTAYPITSVTIKGLPNLKIIGKQAFLSKSFTSLQLINLPVLTTIDDYAFEGNASLGTVYFEDVPSLTTLGMVSFSNCTSLYTINLDSVTSLTTIGQGAFSNDGWFATFSGFDLSKLTNLTTIGPSAFSACNFSEINLTGLQKLQSIGDWAFSGNYYMQNINLVNLPSLTSIGSGAFSYNYYYTTFYGQTPTLHIGGLRNDLSLPTSTNAFPSLVGSGIITPVGATDSNNPTEDDLAMAIKFRDYINTGNSFKTANSVWYINATITSEYIDEKGRTITKGTDGTPIAPQIFNVRISDPALNQSDYFTAPDAPSIAGYENGKLLSDSPQAVTELNQTITYEYDQVAPHPFTVYWVDTDGNPLDTQVFNGEYDTIVDLALREFPDYGFRTLMSSDNADSASTGDWDDAIDMLDNPDELDYGDNNGRSYKFVYAAKGSVTYKYIDQYGDPIAVDGDGADVTPFNFAGLKGDTYDFPGVPSIAGYGPGQYVSGVESGSIDAGDREVVYQFRKIAAPITIYRVDDNGTNLEDPEVISGYVDDIIDLTPKSFANYDFKDLYGTTLLAPSRFIPTAGWELHDELVGTKVTFDDNANRNYTFVYDKQTVTTPDTPTTPTTPGGLPGTGGLPTTPKPVAKPVTKPGKTPGKLPGTGQDKKHKQNKPKKDHAKKGNTKKQASAKRTKTTLPKSGNMASFLLPSLGALILAGLLGWFGLNKRRS